jgi:spore coat polysaccharide biosynthesis protein SpsF (cytidylyltransferase family)
MLHRCKLSKKLKRIVLATTTLEQDNAVEKIGRLMGVEVFRGSANDVLHRYIGAAEQTQAQLIVRITADCPLIDYTVIDDVIDAYRDNPADYVFIDGYPNGIGAAEVVTLSALQKAMEETSPEDVYYREHVITYLLDNPHKFTISILPAPLALRRPELRLCVDEPADLEVVKLICQHFHPRLDFRTAEIIDFLDRNPHISTLNSHVQQKTR